MKINFNKYKKTKSFYEKNDDKYPDVTLAHRGIVIDDRNLNFIKKANKENDSMILEGQSLKFTRGIYSNIKVVGFSMYGNYSGDFLFYLDGEYVGKVKIGLTDLQSTKGNFENKKILKSKKMIDTNGSIYKMDSAVWVSKINFPKIEADEVIMFDNPFTVVSDIELGEN